MSYNDITGDKIATKATSQAYRNNWDNIDWSKKPKDDTDDILVEMKESLDSETKRKVYVHPVERFAANMWRQV